MGPRGRLSLISRTAQGSVLLSLSIQPRGWSGDNEDLPLFFVCFLKKE